MGTWAVAKCKTYIQRARKRCDMDCISDLQWLVYSVWDMSWTAINALVISSDLCSVWQFHIFYITMTGSFLLSSCSVFLLIIKLTSTWSCLYSRPWATPEQPLVEDTHTCTALSFVTLRTSWVYKITSMEDRHSVKLSRLLAFDCAGIEQLSVCNNSCAHRLTRRAD